MLEGIFEVVLEVMFEGVFEIVGEILSDGLAAAVGAGKRSSLRGGQRHRNLQQENSRWKRSNQKNQRAEASCRTGCRTFNPMPQTRLPS